MYGVFKQLTANDIKITPFEAHKQYSITGSNFASNGIVTSSAFWSNSNKSDFLDKHRKYYQIDKLYYNNYPKNLANLFETIGFNYKKQDRRLYESASIISIPQYTFGNGIQPGSVEIETNDGDVLVDDSFGNLHIKNQTDNYPDIEDRVLYLGPTKAFKYRDENLNIDPISGNPLTNRISTFSGTYYDDSLYNNSITYTDILFGSGGLQLPNNNPDSITVGTYGIINATTSSRVEIANRPYLNFDNKDFAISFWFYNDDKLNTDWLDNVDDGDRIHLITKEGAINKPTNVVDNDLGSNTNNTTQPGTGKYPYKIFIERIGNNIGRLGIERSDGDITFSKIFSPNIVAPAFDNEFIHVVIQRNNGVFEMYLNGDHISDTSSDTTVDTCSNNSNIVLFSKRNNDGSYTKNTFTHTAPLQHLSIWNKAFASSNEVERIYESVHGTKNVGNIFYDNGFCVLTQVNKRFVDLDRYPVGKITYKNTYPITEYEYQCTVGEQEYNYTSNITARKVPTFDNDEFASFTTGSSFKPYVTTIGLYDNNSNLLAVGKLGQPIKMSEETDTTFVIRFDK